MAASHPALERFLARLLLRSTLGGEERRAILQLPYRIDHIQSRIEIVSPGDSVSNACLVAKGLVGRFDQMRDGRRQIAAFYIPGDMCDLHSVVAPTAGWGIVALTSSTILRVPHSDLRRLATGYPAIAMAFWRDGTVDASVLAKWVGNLGRQDARSRLAHVLCEVGTRMERAGFATRNSFDFDVTQEQLADAIGLTSVHVNRTIQKLRGEGILSMRAHRVEIADWNRLADIAEFDPTYLLFDRSPSTAEQLYAMAST
jgi:CRP-like cAMP-binding protein